ncbi:hypothetical protein [Streptomyces sp. P9-A2]|uniref:hypothetical protein n=1 Tax=Streptomyces sp. P9-A2 TaxID=3072284 RepID=UPI002FC963A4
MDQFFLLFSVLLALLCAGSGAYAVVTGRVSVRWVRRPVHPQLWGAGTLVMGLAVGTVRIAPFTVFMVLFLCAMSLQVIAYAVDGAHK